jgi:hypothetical protein
MTVCWVLLRIRKRVPPGLVVCSRGSGGIIWCSEGRMLGVEVVSKRRGEESQKLGRFAL